MARVELPLWVLVIAGWLLVTQRGRDRGVLARLGWAAGLVWLTEQSLIRAHGYHFYPQGWIVSVGAVPLALVMWWALALVTAYEVTRPNTAPRRSALSATALVLVDAAVVLPWLSVTGAIRFNGAGPFGVPPIAFAVIGLLAYAIGPVLRYLSQRTWQSSVVDGLGAAGTVHFGALVSWHVGLKWTETKWPGWVSLVVAAGVSAAAISVLRSRPGEARRRYAVVRSFGLGPVAAGLARGADLWQWAWTAMLAAPYVVARRRRPGSEKAG